VTPLLVKPEIVPVTTIAGEGVGNCDAIAWANAGVTPFARSSLPAVSGIDVTLGWGTDVGAGSDCITPLAEGGVGTPGPGVIAATLAGGGLPLEVTLGV
ncbi:MAG: hypothetical protein ACREM6_01205, partial [Vulcanimicrobiaceae bacterium]